MRIGEGNEQRGVLRQFVGLFDERGWLRCNLKIRYQGISYRIFCSETEFLAYRINDNPCVPPGVPGWPVCMVRQDEVFHDSELCTFPSPEPGPRDWLRCMADGDFEVI
ncbi:MAG: hypothetical protein ABSC19_14890 [Syntrophorhabdales bacterium]